ncbi:MAG TPA: purine-nucleoside phosphorylase [bacterium]|nr:purine-nucleoside phosphorylase [bacterium]HPN42494.1 purine-nucleoside phosphorylase [bacterium]
MLLKNKVQESLEYIRPLIPLQPEIAVILGSGMGAFADYLENTVTIAAGDIPHYPVSTVPGHAGAWRIGNKNHIPVICIQGRVHYYEGYTLEQVSYPVHLLAGLGIKTLIVTTACGGLNPDFRPGDMMLIRDHINFGFGNPLIGRPENLLGPWFPDMSEPYDSALQEIALSAAAEKGIQLQRGVFCWVTGPSYETAAEVRMLRKLGGDAVSMSTVPEVIVANQRHIRTLGISLITNMATGLAAGKLTHQEVTDMAHLAGEKLNALLDAIIRKMS